MSTFPDCLSVGFIVEKRYRDHSALVKDNISSGLAYSVRGLVLYHHGRKQGSVQTDMVLEEVKSMTSF